MGAFTVKWGWHPREIDTLTAAEFEMYAAIVDQLNKGG